MKAFAVIAAAMVFGFAPAQAENDKPITVKQLPMAAQKFINSTFKGKKVSVALMDKGVFETDYTVIFNNGQKVEFDKSGAWKEVDCKRSAVPSGIVPGQIKSYVSRNYPNVRIQKIDRDRKGYEVKLSNGLEVTFDKRFRVVDIDD